MRRVIFLLALACGVLSAPAEDEAVHEFVQGNHKFSSGVYKEIIKKEKGSFITSPFSAETILALTSEGARGKTSVEFIAGLALPSNEEKTHEAFKTLLPKLTKSEKHLKLLSANKVYVGEGVELEDNFKDIASGIYRSGVENVDFSQSIETAKKINLWVENSTNHKIENLIKSDKIDGNTRMVLVNALYFSGNWIKPFNAIDTKKKNFYRSEKDYVEVDTMKQVTMLKYYEHPELAAKFVEMKYDGTDDISMVIVLPDEKEGLASLEEHIDELFEPQDYTMEKVDIEIPKFKIETEIGFIPILQNLGIKAAFQPNADFSGISSTDKDLAISEVLQKAFIDITEIGTEAAAATAVTTNREASERLLPGEITFHADHPFFYYIKHGDVVLFEGRYYA